jgi:perosamine synthetase
MARLPLIEPVIGRDEIESVTKVLESGYLTQGPITETFEERFASFVGARHGVATTSCTTGLELALLGFEVGEGDEVILPDFTHPATANAIVRTGATPVIVDVDRETYNIDIEAVRGATTQDTAAILPVSWGGQPLEAASLKEIADAKGAVVVEDAACSAGASFDDIPTGSQFDASVFSFHPRKVLTTGEGGMVVTDDSELEETMRRIKNFGTNPRKDNVGFERANATNFRLSDVLAAIGVEQLKKKQEIIRRRQELASRYHELLEPVKGVCRPKTVPGGTHTYQSYCVYVEAGDDDLRDELIEDLAEQEIETQIGTYALSNTDAFGDATRGSDLSTAHALEANLLTLPVAHSMTDKDQQRVVDALEAAL